MAFWNKKKKIKHVWEYLPFFQISNGIVIAVQVCKTTGAARYVRVPSTKKLMEMEQQARNQEDY